MAVGDTARLIASLELANKMGPGLASVNKDLGRLEGRAYKAGAQIGTGIKNAGRIAAVGIAAIVSQVVLGLDSLVELEKQEAQTGAVLKSTGQAAGVNAAMVTKLSEKYENLNATVGDEFIRAGQNMLLTFTNIKGKAFEPALATVLDLNTAMGKGPEGLTKTAILVGKALNDPTKGLTALTRVGVSFSKEQIKRIKGLQAEGKTYEAQRIILKELNKEFGGSFLAQGGTTGGKVAKFHDAIEDLQRTLAAGFLPVVSKVADAMSSFLADPAVVKGVEQFGTKLASLFSDANLTTGANVLRGLFQTAKDVAPAIASAARVTGEVVKTAVQAFTSLPKELQTLLVGGLAVNKLTGGLVTNIAGGLISSVLKQLVSGVVNVHGASVIVTGATGVPGATPGGKPGGIPAVLGLAVPLAGVAASIGPEPTKRVDAQGNVTSEVIGENIPKWTAMLQTMVAQGRSNEVINSRTGETVASELRRLGVTVDDGSDRSTAAVEGMRALLGTKLERVASNTIAAGVAAKNAGDKTAAAARVAGITAGLASRRAGEVAKSGGTAAASAIRHKRLSTVVNVTTRLNIDSREWLRQATVTNIRGGAS